MNQLQKVNRTRTVLMHRHTLGVLLENAIAPKWYLAIE
jgi:hypothetical protein